MDHGQHSEYWRSPRIVRTGLTTGDFSPRVCLLQVSLYTFVTPLGSSMMAPALPDIAAHYGITSETEVAATLSIFLITFAIGPLFLAPMSEIYGRTWVRAAGFTATGGGS